VGHKALPQINLLSKGVWLEDLLSLKEWVKSCTLNLLTIVEVVVNNLEVYTVMDPGVPIFN
jgi:hypothetical protein